MPLRLRAEVDLTDTDTGVVLLDERTGRYWQLNLTGAHVLRRLLAGHDLAQVARELASRHRAEIHQVQEHIRKVLAQLHTADLVEPT